MSVITDSNILVYSVQPQSPFYQDATDAVIELRRQGEVLCVIPQNLIEFWVVATRPINVNGLGMNIAQAHNELTRLKGLFQLLPDKAAIFPEWERLVVQQAVMGKATHDTRIVAAMNVHGVTKILTENKDDFKRFQNITALEPKDVIQQPPQSAPSQNPPQQTPPVT